MGRNVLVLVLVSEELSGRTSSMNDSVNVNDSHWSVVNCYRSG